MSWTGITAIVPTDGSDAVLTSGTQLNLVETPTDPVNGNAVPLTGREVVLLHNTDSVAHTVTLHSVADNFGRTNDITSYSIPANTIAVISFLGMLGAAGWKQTDGTLHLTSSNDLLTITVLQINLI